MQYRLPARLDEPGFDAALPSRRIVSSTWWAPWCGPLAARFLRPIFERAALKHPGRHLRQGTPKTSPPSPRSSTSARSRR